MPSNDVRNLLHTAVPTAAVGVVAAVVSGVVAGGKGALGAAVGTLVVILFMGIGLVVLQRTAKSLPQLFQAMGLMLYTAQLLLLFIFMALFKNTTLFHPRAFAITLIVATVAWVSAQARAHMKAKILYVEPESSTMRQGREDGVVGVRGRAGISTRTGPCYRPVSTAALRARASELTPVLTRGLKPESCRSHTCKTCPVPNRGPAPHRHNEVAVPMRHSEGARGEC